MNDRDTIIDILRQIASDKRMLNHADYWALICGEAAELLKAQEPRHGEWKWSHGGECSECGFHNSNFDYKFCPMCGL